MENQEDNPMPQTREPMPIQNLPAESKLGLTILSRCGGGAYGDVYYCQDVSGKRLALKVISKAKLGDDWKRELKGLINYRKLTEDTLDLLRIYHVAENDESFYYTMEPADAVPVHDIYTPDTLARRLSKGALPQSELLPTLEDILDSIAALHNAGYAHRDIKPENILFVGGRPKLGDVGLLSPLSGTLTRLAGTLDYMPPEQRRGDSPDTRTSQRHNDLYAFGKIIYCCISGKSAGEFPSLPNDFPLTLPDKLLFRLSLRLCDREPTRRISSLPDVQAEFARAMRLCKTGEGIHDRLAYALSELLRNSRSLSLRATRWILRHKIVSAAVFTFFAIGCVALARYLTSLPDSESVAVAQLLQEQKRTASSTHFQAKAFTFLDGMYSVAVPTDWMAFDHEAIAAQRQDEISRSLHGLFVPADAADGNAATVVTLHVLPVPAQSILNKTPDEQQMLMKQVLGDDIEAIAFRKYTNQRLNLETLLLVGEAAPSRLVVSFAYPRGDHTLLVSALMQQERYEQEMGTFLAINDSLVYYNHPQKTQ